MIEQEMSIVIDQPVSEVFELVTNPQNIPGWAPDAADARHSPVGPVAVGTRIWQTVRGREFHWEITAYETDKLCAYKADSVYFSGPVTVHVEAIERGTGFTVHDKGDRKGLLKLFEPILNRFDVNACKQQLATIREILEGDSS